MFKPIGTLRSKLVKVKDKMPREKMSNLVYEILCGSQGCVATYVGETKQSLCARLEQHRHKGFNKARSLRCTYSARKTITLQQHRRGNTQLRRGLGLMRHQGGYMGKGGADFT